MPFETRILQPEEYEIAAGLLRQGECVAFPTETVYGLGANALDENAVAKIYQAKGRPSDNPLIVHCPNQSQVKEFVKDWTAAAQLLMDRFWPGPLTLILPKKAVIPPIVTAGLDTVAVRIPNHPVALKLLRAARLPVAAPSANASGKPSPTRAEHVWQDLAGKIPAIIDGGPTGWGLESTVLDCTANPFRLLRPGGVTVEELQKLMPITVDAGGLNTQQAPPSSPGMKYKHYSPDAQVVLVEGRGFHPLVQAEIDRHRGWKVAVIAFSESRGTYRNASFLDLGSKNDLAEAASRLYHLLREADRLGADFVVVEGLSEEHLGMAIMNRFRKAAATIVRP